MTLGATIGATNQYRAHGFWSIRRRNCTLTFLASAHDYYSLDLNICSLSGTEGIGVPPQLPWRGIGVPPQPPALISAAETGRDRSTASASVGCWVPSQLLGGDRSTASASIFHSISSGFILVLPAWSASSIG